MHKFFSIVLLGLAIASALPAGQPAGGDFVIAKSTADGGGGLSAGGDYVLTGTIGQPDANAQVSTGDDFALAGGFWAEITEFVVELIFSDGFE
jgi:hypothetical protein